jgi:hypothetical protein
MLAEAENEPDAVLLRAGLATVVVEPGWFQEPGVVTVMVVGIWLLLPPKSMALPSA